MTARISRAAALDIALANRPRGLRNNNPGNIRRGPDKWQGMAPPELQTDPAFVVFDSMVWGIRAIARILIRYQDHHELDTIERLIARYAPPDENATERYVAFVAKYTRFDARETLDLHTYEHLRILVEAIVVKEVGHDHGISAAEFDAGLARAGVLPPEAPLTATRTVKGAQVATGGTFTVAAVAEYARQAQDVGAAVSPILDLVQRFGPWLVVAVAVAGVGYIVWARIDTRRRGIA